MATEKTLRKRENTRARPIEAGARVFTDKGFAGAKIDDVVTTAGFTQNKEGSICLEQRDYTIRVLEQQIEDDEHFGLFSSRVKQRT